MRRTKKQEKAKEKVQKKEVDPEESGEVRKGNQRWSETETLSFLEIWKRDEVQTFFKTHRHALVWESLATEHNLSGYDRDKGEVFNRMKNLRSQYSLKKPKSGAAPPSWVYWPAIHSVLGQRDLYDDYYLEDSLCHDDEDSDDLSDQPEGLKKEGPESAVTKSPARKVKKFDRPPRKNVTYEKKMYEFLVESSKRQDERQAKRDAEEKAEQQLANEEREGRMAMMKAFTAFLNHSVTNPTVPVTPPPEPQIPIPVGTPANDPPYFYDEELNNSNYTQVNNSDLNNSRSSAQSSSVALRDVTSEIQNQNQQKKPNTSGKSMIKPRESLSASKKDTLKDTPKKANPKASLIVEEKKKTLPNILRKPLTLAVLRKLSPESQNTSQSMEARKPSNSTPKIESLESFRAQPPKTVTLESLRVLPPTRTINLTQEDEHNEEDDGFEYDGFDEV